MKRKAKVDICGKIKNVNIQQHNNTRRVRFSVETEELNEGIKLRIPVTLWESEGDRELNLLTKGTTVHVVGKFRVRYQTTACRVVKTARDIVASKVETI